MLDIQQLYEYDVCDKNLSQVCDTIAFERRRDKRRHRLAVAIIDIRYGKLKQRGKVVHLEVVDAVVPQRKGVKEGER